MPTFLNNIQQFSSIETEDKINDQSSYTQKKQQREVATKRAAGKNSNEPSKQPNKQQNMAEEEIVKVPNLEIAQTLFELGLADSDKAATTNKLMDFIKKDSAFDLPCVYVCMCVRACVFVFV